jgi:hypothetical protein
VLRAALVIDAQHRVDADPVFAGPTGIAIFVDAALGTDIGGLAVTTDQSVAAIDLGIALGGGDVQHATASARTLAAIDHRGAHARIADLTIAAVAIRATFSAVAGVTGDAALPSAAVQLQVFAGLALGDAKVRALAQWYTFIIAAFLTLIALAVAGAFVTIRAIRAVVIRAAFIVRDAVAIATMPAFDADAGADS